MTQLVGGASAKGKISPLLIVLIVIGGLFVLGIVAVVGAGWFVMSKVEQAGFDTDLLEENPGLAVTKMIAALNPDIEIVSIDEDSKTVKVKDKKSGKTVTVDFDRLREGNLVFEDDEGEKVEFNASQSGADVQTSQGSYQVGAGADVELPDWLAKCRGCELKGVMSSQTGEGRSGMASFTSPDSVEEVIDFYDEALKDAGMEVNTVRQSGAAGGGGMISGEDSGGRKAVIIVGAGNGTTGGSINFTEP